MITDGLDGVQRSTKQRLLDEAARLFAERGYTATSVGDIEAAAGLQPRRGALYKHYASKLDVLRAIVRRHIESVDRAAVALEGLPLTDLRAEALMMGRWLLDELDRQRALTHILEQDGHRIPEMRDAARDHISDAGYRSACALLERWLDGRRPGTDAASVAVCLVGAVINYRRSSWTFGAPPIGLTDDRFLDGWGDVCVAFAGA
jgi:AcrR family transcriptional regulator